jgi:hypothetical protein
MKDVILTHEQFLAVKHLVGDLISSAESVFENQYDSIEEDSPGLYHSLVEFHESWEGSKTREALELWADEIDR